VAHESDEHRSGDLEYSENGLGVGTIVVGIVAIAAVIFALQNSDDTTMEFLFFKATVPLSVVIVISIILGAILGWFVGVMRRRRKRNRLD
jgi:uncharacterized integral membrane protein